jgi:hypothetical protein
MSGLVPAFLRRMGRSRGLSRAYRSRWHVRSSPLRVRRPSWREYREGDRILRRVVPYIETMVLSWSRQPPAQSAHSPQGARQRPSLTSDSQHLNALRLNGLPSFTVKSQKLPITTKAQVRAPSNP